MPKEHSEKQTAVEEHVSKKPRFGDTWQGFAVFVIALLVLRFLVFEPFKIPTGSMEPTLIGHEDYGDRIVTNKLAYSGGTNPVAVFGGEPKRFDVFVFVHDSAWQVQNEKQLTITNSLKRNYIKRCVGLPGETITISGGDLFLNELGKDHILRKWETSMDLQMTLWQPVSAASFRTPVLPAGASALQQLIARQKDNRAFPWDVAGTGTVVRSASARSAEVTGPVTLTYRHPVTNVYAKLGRWPYIHAGCPAVDPSGFTASDGTVFNKHDAKSIYITPYLADFWSGVECPNCGQIQFPLIRHAPKSATTPPQEAPPEGAGAQASPVPEPPFIVPALKWEGTDLKKFMSSEPDTNAAKGYFFYGGEDIVGDLQLELELEVLQPGGALELEVGSNLHRASWTLSLGGTAPVPTPDATRHAVTTQVALAPGAKHVLTLAYVDGSVLSALDGTPNEPLKIDVAMADRMQVKSLAQVRLHGESHVRITRLNLYRDLFYTLNTDDRLSSPVDKYTNDYLERDYDPVRGRFRFTIPKDRFLALGDNSPSSVDSRFWGFVPRKNLVGRASFLFWPPSRWRLIR